MVFLNLIDEICSQVPTRNFSHAFDFFFSIVFAKKNYSL